MKQTKGNKRIKPKRIWDKEQLAMLRELAQQAEIDAMLRSAVEDRMDDGDLRGALDILEGFAQDSNEVYHWAMTQICLVHMLLNDLEKALKTITDVLYQYDDCLYAQFYFATVLFIRGQPNDAIEIWKRIVKKGAAKVASAKCDCCEGLEWAENVVADCKCSLGFAYKVLGRHTKANHWFERYEEDSKRGRSGLMVWEIDED